ncbi:glycogen synthase kinase-3 beta [Drosophila persimilis]|nr:glycogen synthase kinase-3 beta [Drosophila persimilis]
MGHQYPVTIPSDAELKVLPVADQPGIETEPVIIKFRRSIGHGAFGRVYIGTVNHSRKAMAIKQTCLDTSICYREPEIMNRLQGHCNIRHLHMHTVVPLGDPPQEYMLLVMDYLPMTLAQFIRHSLQRGNGIDLVYIRIFSYQLFRGLAYLHSMGICHRDIKPENLMINDRTMLLQLSDFGSAKCLRANEPSITYICSRFYRAPELYANCQYYNCSVDIWSAGCVLAELFKGEALFSSIHHNEEQLRWMVQLLGTDGLQSAPEIRQMCGFKNRTLPLSRRRTWDKILGRAVPPDLAEVLNRCLVYDPSARIYPLYACAHESYDELRSMEFLDMKMPNGNELPPLFNFSKYELKIHSELWVHLLPMCLYNKYKPSEPKKTMGTFTKYFPVQTKDGTTV